MKWFGCAGMELGTFCSPLQGGRREMFLLCFYVCLAFFLTVPASKTLLLGSVVPYEGKLSSLRHHS